MNSHRSRRTAHAVHPLALVVRQDSREVITDRYSTAGVATLAGEVVVPEPKFI